MLSNEVVISILVLVLLSTFRVNVIVSLVISSIVAGLIGHNAFDGFGEALKKTIDSFTGGLGGGAETAMNYALLGAFAVALYKAGIVDLIAYKIINYLGNNPNKRSVFWFKYLVIFVITLMAISSQNLIPIHIAFIPIVIPMLLPVMNKFYIDRRAIACAITFGLTATYMFIPAGFGQIFIESILVKNINLSGEQFGIKADVASVTKAMLIPVIGMSLGLLWAVFVSYRKKRIYADDSFNANQQELVDKVSKIKIRHIYFAVFAIFATGFVQLTTNSTIMGGLSGLLVLAFGGVFKPSDSDDMLRQGLQLMSMIAFVMIAASGFAAVIKSTGGINDLVNSFQGLVSNKAIASLLMLLIGLFVTMGIGSSFSTVPIITSIFVPICVAFGFSALATISIIGVASALGDAGSPVSDSTLGPTSGLNVDGKHDHMRDSVWPTFIHFNIPLLVFGWLASIVL